MTSRKGLIIALVLLNFLLLAMVLIGPGASSGQAQVMGATDRYVPFSAKYAEGREAIYIVDLERRGLAAVHLVPAADGGLVFEEFRGRDLLRDFGRD